MTSGLGGRFLEGYPVAIVESVSRDGKNYFATVTAKPLASIDKLRYVLLLWPTNEDMRKVNSITPEDVRKAVQQRIDNQGNEANKVKKTVVPEDNDNNNPPPTDDGAQDTPADGEINVPAPVMPNEQHKEED